MVKLPRRIAHCHWWPMMAWHGSLWTSMLLKRNIFHRQICPWTSKRWWIFINVCGGLSDYQQGKFLSPNHFGPKKMLSGKHLFWIPDGGKHEKSHFYRTLFLHNLAQLWPPQRKKSKKFQVAFWIAKYREISNANRDVFSNVTKYYKKCLESPWKGDFHWFSDCWIRPTCLRPYSRHQFL